MRERIVRLVRDFPGLHLRELARQADTSLNLVQYHVQKLQDGGHVEVALAGGKVRVFAPGMPAQLRSLLGAVRDRPRLRIVMTLLESESLTHGDLAKRLKMGKSTLSFHLRALEDAALVEKRDGFRLRDAAFVRGALQDHRPTPDMVDRLAGLWERVYD